MPYITYMPYMPYTKTTYGWLSRFLVKHDIKSVALPPRKIFSYLPPVKDALGLRTPGIYSIIPCECSRVYIGRSGRTIQTRTQEHNRHITLAQTNKSAVTEHSTNHDLIIKLQDTNSPPMPPNVLHGFCGLPSRLWPKCNWLLRLGRPGGTVTLSQWVDGDIWIWRTRRGLNLSSTKLPRPWSAWESSPSRKNPQGRTRNRTRNLLISSQKLWPLDHKAGKKTLTSFS
jgi:hypothetical protein